MLFSKKYVSLVSFLLIIPVLAFALSKSQNHKGEIMSVHTSITPTITPLPIDTSYSSYNKPILAKSDKYNIFLIGDSMTHAFGPRGGIFTELLRKDYPDTNFEVYNYGQAGFNLLQLPKMLDEEEIQTDDGHRLRPVLSGEPTPDLIIIESFGYNPLSDLGEEEGLKKQDEVLLYVMKKITDRYPDTVIMFSATIAPDKKTYSMSATGADEEGRRAQAEERIMYIKNHMDFAREYNIPVIDTYTPSLDSEGDGDTKYINPDDDIHPSEEGLAHMARIMVRRIQEEKSSNRLIYFYHNFTF